MDFSLERFKNLKTEELECEVVTPLFLGGADRKSADLRTASIKGILRFWWRAIYGSDALADMKKSESEIFGSTDQKSNLTLRITESNIKISSEKLHKSGFHILNYLAYGYNDNKGNIRQHIEPKSTFKILIIINDKQTDEQSSYYNKIMTSFSAMICLGGLGMRSRSGLGSLYSQDFQRFNLSKYCRGDVKKYTSLTVATRLFVTKQKSNTWDQALAQIGNLYKEAKMLLKSKGGDTRKYIDGASSHHSKPYFLHVNKLDNGKFQGQILFMPYRYAPGGKFNDDQLKRYREACDKMNDYLKEEAKEVKHEF
ncbi:MAG: type III-B CRISPR module RAMP protein Cmr1 [Campylobacterota bacterium]|nr:type III-B CRISPR module RAMP protein Cmr1 [Campylobacterota bacterium]